MTNLPRFERGEFGALKFDHLNTTFDTVDEVNANLPDLIARLDRLEELRMRRDFPARLTHTVIGDLNEITAGEQWTYPWAEEVHEWDSMAQVVTAALKTNGRTSQDENDAEDEDRFATNMLEGRTPAQLEKYVANCPAPDTGDTAVDLNFKRQPLPPGTPVWIRPVSTDDGTRFIIVGLRGAYPSLCGYCEEPV